MPFRVNLTLDDNIKYRLDVMSILVNKPKATFIKMMVENYLLSMDELLASMGIDIKNDTVQEVKEKFKDIKLDEVLGKQFAVILNHYKKMEVKDIEKKE